MACRQVSIHAPTRGATSCCHTSSSSSPSFNPRTDTGCDVCLAVVSSFMPKFQSTHRHGVRPAPIVRGPRLSPVSIHAPTRGATSKPAPCALVIGVSIHAPTRGATRPNTPCRREYPVSIHAPTRGATRWSS